jgi:hypothetical protein
MPPKPKTMDFKLWKKKWKQNNKFNQYYAGPEFDELFYDENFNPDENVEGIEDQKFNYKPNNGIKCPFCKVYIKDFYKHRMTSAHVERYMKSKWDPKVNYLCRLWNAANKPIPGVRTGGYMLGIEYYLSQSHNYSSSQRKSKLNAIRHGKKTTKDYICCVFCGSRLTIDGIRDHVSLKHLKAVEESKEDDNKFKAFQDQYRSLRRIKYPSVADPVHFLRPESTLNTYFEWLKKQHQKRNRRGTGGKFQPNPKGDSHSEPKHKPDSVMSDEYLLSDRTIRYRCPLCPSRINSKRERVPSFHRPHTLIYGHARAHVPQVLPKLELKLPAEGKREPKSLDPPPEGKNPTAGQILSTFRECYQNPVSIEEFMPNRKDSRPIKVIDCTMPKWETHDVVQALYWYLQYQYWNNP